MIPQRYEDNMAALQLILEECKKNNINVLLYIPPIRSDIPLPYQNDLYHSFKSSVKEICMKEKGLFYFADFDTIIPGNLWGYKEATNLTEKREADYMHFQFKGHQILADSLYNHLKLLNN
jgi:lysophospholipase L1-like esterase